MRRLRPPQTDFQTRRLRRVSHFTGTTSSRSKRRNLFGKNCFRNLCIRPRWFCLSLGWLRCLQRDVVLALIIWSIILLNTGFSFWREYRAEQAIEKLREILPSFAHVIREGIESYIPSSDVVPGDMLVLAEGDNIPADARVIEEYGLRTNNATLTGEAIPARKTADPSYLTGISELDRPNLIFAGTSIASGTGRAVVTATGMSTQFGRIAHLTQSIPEEPTPFQKELNHLSKVTAWIALLIGGIVVAVGYFSLGFPVTRSDPACARYRCGGDSRRTDRHAYSLFGGGSSTSRAKRRAGEKTIHGGEAWVWCPSSAPIKAAH